MSVSFVRLGIVKSESGMRPCVLCPIFNIYFIYGRNLIIMQTLYFILIAFRRTYTYAVLLDILLN